MDWETWCKTYPCLQANRHPDVDEFFTFASRVDAERYKDILEEDELISTTYRVVEYDHLFFVVAKAEAEELCSGQTI